MALGCGIWRPRSGPWDSCGLGVGFGFFSGWSWEIRGRRNSSGVRADASCDPSPSSSVVALIFHGPRMKEPLALSLLAGVSVRRLLERCFVGGPGMTCSYRQMTWLIGSGNGTTSGTQGLTCSFFKREKLSATQSHSLDVCPKSQQSASRMELAGEAGGGTGVAAHGDGALLWGTEVFQDCGGGRTGPNMLKTT